MLEELIALDKELFLLLNGIHSPFWDQVMWYISAKTTWIPLYLAMIFFMIRKYRWQSILIIIMAIVTVTLADQISNHCFKDVFQRFRPCHTPDIKSFVHKVNGKCGGKYGFVSSHATNHFAIAVYTLFIFRKHWYTIAILIWAAIVAYSRVYLGVHFPADIICGGILGVFIGTGVYYGTKILSQKIYKKTYSIRI